MSTSPGKCKDIEADEKDLEDSQGFLTAMGKLSLNVQAVPYIPRQDGGSNVNPDIQDSGSEKNGGDEGRVMYEKQNGHETKEELRAQIASLKQGLKQYEDMIGEYHVSEQTRKREVDSALITAREVVERERREKLDVLSDCKSREEKFEHLSKTLSVLQVENEELLEMTRKKDEKLAELSRLKTLIQENGFPNVDQFLVLQTQLDTVREECYAERKERERIQSQKDKIKRELDASQSRIASLQEQVYKYREHIYFIQNKFKQPPLYRPLSGLDSGGNSRPISASEACKLYGPNATQYINHSLAQSMNPTSPGVSSPDAKFSNRNEKKGFPGGRQWQDNRMPRPMTAGEDGWRRSQQQQQPNRNGNGYYNNNINRMTSSNSTPSLSTITSDGPVEISYYDKNYSKPSFTRRPRSSLSEETAKDYGLADWSKQNKQSKRFPSPLPSPTLLSSPSTELWSPQHPPGFQKTWHAGQEEIFRFPPSPLITPTTKSSFDAWPTPSPLVQEDKVFPPQIPIGVGEENSLFSLPISSSGNTGESSFVHFTVGPSSSKIFICYNCGIHFDDNEAHKKHVETCGL